MNMAAKLTIKRAVVAILNRMAAERSSNACPPCHGGCNQGRNCPARKVRA